MGLLRDVVGAIQYNSAQSHQEKVQALNREYDTLQAFAKEGDDETRQIALAGLVDISQQGLKYNGNHLEQIRNRIAPQMAQGGAERGGPPSSEVMTGPVPPAAQPGTSPTMKVGATAGQGPEVRAIPAVGASLGAAPMAMPAAPAAPAAAPATPPPAPPAAAPAPGSPEEAGQFASRALTAAGVPALGAGPDRGRIASDLAAEYGFTAQQMTDPNFSYVNGMHSPERDRIRTEYRQRLAQATQQAQTEYNSRVGDYTRSVMAYVTTAAAGQRADAATEAANERARLAQEGALRRADLMQRGAEGRAEQGAVRAQERQARASWSAEKAAVDKKILDLNTSMLDPAKGMLLKQQLKSDPGLIDRMRDQGYAAADERYRQLTGQEPPGAVPAAPAKAKPMADQGAKGMAKAAGEPPAAPRGAAGSSLPGPPERPITPDEERHAAQLKAKITRQGSESLTQEDRLFMSDYVKRKGAGQPVVIPGTLGPGPGGPPAPPPGTGVLVVPSPSRSAWR